MTEEEAQSTAIMPNKVQTSEKVDEYEVNVCILLDPHRNHFLRLKLINDNS